jgi:hypothetical protein
MTEPRKFRIEQLPSDVLETLLDIMAGDLSAPTSEPHPLDMLAAAADGEEVDDVRVAARQELARRQADGETQEELPPPSHWGWLVDPQTKDTLDVLDPRLKVATRCDRLPEEDPEV